MLQLFFWLGFWYFFFALPGTRGAILVNSSFNATPDDGLDGLPDVTVCVNNTQHPTWVGSVPDQFNLNTCQKTVNLFLEKVEGNLYTSYDFYSRQAFPSGLVVIGHETWPLAQGASSG